MTGVRSLDILEKKKDPDTGILDTSPTIGGGVVDPNAGVQDMAEQEVAAPEKSVNDARPGKGKEVPAKAKNTGISRYEKKAGADNSSPSPVNTKLAGADRDYKKSGKSKNKSNFGLSDLGKGALATGAAGAWAFSKLGAPLGPGGTLAGAITGGVYGSAVGALNAIGIKGLADSLGIDKKDLEDFLGVFDTTPKTHKKDY